MGRMREIVVIPKAEHETLVSFFFCARYAVGNGHGPVRLLKH